GITRLPALLARLGAQTQQVRKRQHRRAAERAQRADAQEVAPAHAVAGPMIVAEKVEHEIPPSFKNGVSWTNATAFIPHSVYHGSACNASLWSTILRHCIPTG